MKLSIEVIILGIGCAGLLFTLIGGMMTYIRAKKAGILKFRFPAKALIVSNLLVMLCYGLITISSATDAREVRQVLAEAQTEGSAAFLRAENDNATIVLDEERYIAWKTEDYQKKAGENQKRVYGYLGVTLCWSCMLMLRFGFVTKKGWYAMAEQKPRHLIPEEKDGELLFFLGNAAGVPLLRIRNIPENREKYAILLNKDETDEEKTGIHFA